MGNLRETFFTDTPDEESGNKVQAINQNKTLLIDQFTDTVNEPELLQNANKIDDVFEHFKPEKEVEFEDENGSSVSETLRFRKMKDFDVDGGKGDLVKNSDFLLNVQSNIEAATKMKKKIETDKKVRDVLSNVDDREGLKATLQALLDELNAN